METIELEKASKELEGRMSVIKNARYFRGISENGQGVKMESSDYVTEAPKDNKNYVRHNGIWTALEQTSGGTPITVDGELSTNSTNPVQNKVIAKQFYILDKVLGKGEEEKVSVISHSDKYRHLNGTVTPTIGYVVYEPIRVHKGDVIIGRVSESTTAVSILSEVGYNSSFVKTLIRGVNGYVDILWAADKDMFIEISGNRVEVSIIRYNLEPKGGYNRKHYETFGAKFNDDSGYYEYAGLTDITEEEMGIIVNSYIPYLGVGTFDNCKARAFKFNPGVAFYAANSCRICFRGATNMEILYFGSDDYGLVSSYLSSTFQNCYNLREIRGSIDLQNKPDLSGIFRGCAKLTSVKIKKLATDIDIKDSPNFNKESILFMIQNSAATSAIVIKLHATAYAMAMADSEIQAALKIKTNVSLAQG